MATIPKILFDVQDDDDCKRALLRLSRGTAASARRTIDDLPLDVTKMLLWHCVSRLQKSEDASGEAEEQRDDYIIAQHEEHEADEEQHEPGAAQVKIEVPNSTAVVPETEDEDELVDSRSNYHPPPSAQRPRGNIFRGRKRNHHSPDLTGAEALLASMKWSKKRANSGGGRTGSP
ncbi:hypothetical protein HBI71_004970 [Parastagonospora nodorum]|nr:hypothetical protein HBI71_004970 [Parastagonospora nodorum]KAH5414405.1 hypothetical protein HBI47_153220 [Parastagonospora nodorum]